MALAFTKMHGLGNDFVILDQTAGTGPLKPEFLRHLANRRTGVGCDQILVVERSDSAGAKFGYRIYNADGSTAGQCGNGVRCVARWLADRGFTDGGEVALDSPGGVVRTRLLDDGLVTVDMGPPRFEPADIPFVADQRADSYELQLDGEPVRIGAVSMGNPHLVLTTPDARRAPVAELGPRLEHHARFPDRANVGFMEVVGRDHIRLRVYERGAGETLACGTGACAAVAVGRRWQELDERVRVDLPGGRLVVSWSGGDGDPVWMTGPAVEVFRGELGSDR
ncbi:MAG: diaminopimelate epimerase [Gammaproteobacteria bacterium]